MCLGALSLAFLQAGSAAAEERMSLNVLYPASENARFDLNYYRTTHIPLAMQVMKASSVMLIEGVPNGSTPAPYVMICHFEFKSADALKAAMANPEMAKVRADVANFTDIKPTVMVGKSR
jgi:uncharacterized protein (TIGR02118 family)